MNEVSQRLAKAIIANKIQSAEDVARLVVSEPIAIVGMACRFPGGADTPEQFWQLLARGGDAIREVPAERWNVNDFYDPDPDAAGRIYTRWGGFLDDVDKFDAAFFHISPREASSMDPQQRLLLEVAWQALDGGGQRPDRLGGTRTGMFIGISSAEYLQLLLRNCDASQIDAYFGTGNALSVAAARTSYVLGLRGPNLAVDTACSSSLVAVHLACQSLRLGECGLAIAGGVNLALTPEAFVYFCKLRALSPTGRCKTFDAAADGYVRGEGCGVVVLKRLADAVASGDDILAVIRGSAINQDGQTNGLTAPSSVAQAAVIREALANAGVDPSAITYVEAHGTGTPLGDPIEVEALAEVLGRPDDDPGECAIGSVKTNIGHLESAAGIAGLIKVVLALRHRAIPPHLHFQTLNPNISLAGTRLRIPSARLEWRPGDRPLRAGVSSFGFSGTNAHVVLEEAPTATSQEGMSIEPHRPRLFTLSARSSAALDEIAGAHAEFLTSRGTDDGRDWANACFTATARRSHHEHRLAVVARNAAEAVSRLEEYSRRERGNRLSWGHAVASRRPRCAFVFPGQGSQWVGMGLGLRAAEPAFAAVLEECDRLIRREANWSLIEELQNGERIQADVEVIQPAIFSLQVALATLWRHWGIEPDAVVGHSLGEVAAAHVAGALSLEDGLRVICRRSRLVKSTSGHGAMAMVELSMEEARTLLGDYNGHISVAAWNGPQSLLLSGERDAMTDAVTALEGRGVFCRWVKVDYASHSPQMDAVVPLLADALTDVTPRPAQLPIYSTVTGRAGESSRLDATYWARNLRECVQFWPVMKQLIGDGHDVYVEVSPQPVLLAGVEEDMRAHGDVTVVSTLRRGPEEVESVLGGLGELYVAGCEVKWEAVNGGLGKVVELPRYAWQRERYWIEGEKGKDWGAKKKERRGGHGLMGEGWSSAVEKGVHYWEAEVEVEHLAYLADHRVGEATVMPGAGYVEMAVGAAREVYGEEGVVCVEEMEFERAMVVMEGSGRKVQVVMREEGEGRGSVEIHSRGGEGEGGEWVRHARGRIAMSRAERWREGEEGVEEARERCEEALDAQEHYEELKKRSLDYGPSLRGVEAVWRAEREAVGRVRLRDRESAEAGQYWVHPALLDACFQLVAAAGMEAQSREAGEAERMYLPVAVKSVQMRGRAGTAGWGHAVLDGGPQSNGEVRADVRLVNDRGETVVAVRGLRFEAIERVGKKQQWREWLYEVQWRQSERAEEGGSSGHEEKGSWLLLSEGGAIAEGVRRGVQERAQRCVEVRAGRRYRKVSEGLYEVDGSDVEQMQRLLEEAFGETERCVAVVHLWGLGAAEQIGTEGELDEAQERGCLSVLHWVQALAHAGWRDEPRLWLVTRGAQAVEHAEEADGLAQATMWGLGRVVAHEHPELRCTRIDLDPAGDRAQGDVDDLLGELCSAGREDEIALRHHARFVPRLTPFTNGESAPLRRPAGERAYRLEIERTGVLDDLTLRATESSSVGPDEVEIEVEVAGLNFMDVLLVLGIVAPDQAGPITLGGECSGRVTAVGSRVQGLAVGDEVIAVAPFSFGRTTRTLAQFVVPKPNRLTFEQAASVPLVFMTAEYALNHLAHLQQGERVLIHAAAGGVGLAAVQLARLARAEIFATAGSDEKKAYLRDIGVTHVMNSRSLDFADEVLRATGGYGVDVILNSLAAGAVGKNLEILAPFGRFLEIGKRDIYGDGRLALAPFRKNLSYFAVDLARMSHERAHQFAALLRDVVKRFDSGELRPLPVRVFPISAAKDAFRFMQQSKHIGKIAITFAPERSSVPIALDRQPVDADATYWITGGLGGLGRKVARWMVERGARHLVLMGRGGGTEEARREVEALREGGAEVRVEVADVADEEELRGVVGRMEATMPRLRGVIHAAGVLDDGILLQQSAQRFRAVMAPKVKGAWNLHQLTRDRQLDFFVLFSSAASVVGSPGQGNYSAGNAFLDSLSAHRRALGLPCLTINWGPWSEVGMAVAGGSRRNGAPKFRDVSIDPRDGVSILEHLLRREARPTLVMPFHGAPWWEKTFRMAESPLLTDLVAHRGLNFQDRKLRNELLSLGPGPERRLRLENHLRMAVARVSGIEMERLTPEQSLIDLGLDSLMAVELENRLEATLGVSLSAAAVFNHPTISALATYVARRMELPADERDEARGIEELKGAAEDDEDTASILRPGSAFDDPRGSGVSVASGKDLA